MIHVSDEGEIAEKGKRGFSSRSVVDDDYCLDVDNSVVTDDKGKKELKRVAADVRGRVLVNRYC